MCQRWFVSKMDTREFRWRNFSQMEWFMMIFCCPFLSEWKSQFFFWPSLVPVYCTFNYSRKYSLCFNLFFACFSVISAHLNAKKHHLYTIKDIFLQDKLLNCVYWKYITCHIVNIFSCYHEIKMKWLCWTIVTITIDKTDRIIQLVGANLLPELQPSLDLEIMHMKN